MSTRGKIPKQALALAQEILEACDAKKGRVSPLKIFTAKLEGALLQAYDAGVRVGRRQPKKAGSRPQDLN